MITNRLIIPLLLAASVAFARGTTGHNKETLASSTKTGSETELASTFSVRANGTVEFQLDVANNTSRMMELRFPSGMTHDFVVEDEIGREVWRWSKSRMFTQGMQNRLLKSKEVAVFKEHWDFHDAKGKYVAIAELRSDNHPFVERVAFELK